MGFNLLKIFDDMGDFIRETFTGDPRTKEEKQFDATADQYYQQAVSQGYTGTKEEYLEEARRLHNERGGNYVYGFSGLSADDFQAQNDAFQQEQQSKLKADILKEQSNRINTQRASYQEQTQAQTDYLDELRSARVGNMIDRNREMLSSFEYDARYDEGASSNSSEARAGSYLGSPPSSYRQASGYSYSRPPSYASYSPVRNNYQRPPSYASYSPARNSYQTNPTTRRSYTTPTRKNRTDTTTKRKPTSYTIRSTVLSRNGGGVNTGKPKQTVNSYTGRSTVLRRMGGSYR